MYRASTVLFNELLITGICTVKCTENIHDVLFGRNGLPVARHYASDGIHLSKSEIERLLDGINIR